MITVSKKTFSILSGLLIGLLGASPVMADDTEIYLGTTLGLAEINPNILFVIDNSGSMDTLVQSQETYDPGTTYAGTCDPNRVYWTSGNSSLPSSCGNYVELSAFTCKRALEAFTTGGTFTNRAGQYRSNRWRSLSSTDHTNYVECRSDREYHGNGGSELYAAHSWNGGPWKSSSSNTVRFSSNEGYSNYTFRTGNYRNWQLYAGGQDKSRLEIVKDAVHELLNGLNDVNIGLMHFDDDVGSGDEYDGGLVAYAMEDIATARSPFLTVVDNLSPDTYTPLGETMYEAALYFRGDGVHYGNESEPIHSVAASRSSNPNVYESPITSECQQNYIVYLTDGDPTRDSGVTSSMMNSVANKTDCQYISNDDSITDTNYQSNCLDDIAQALNTQDVLPGMSEDQHVTTHTIGFGTGMSDGGVSLLRSAAIAGGGEYHPANDTSSLVTVFHNIVGSILETNSTFSSPAVSVNAFNRTSHLDHLYFSLFRPDHGSHWDGNFKRYRLDFDNNGNAVIVDVNDDPAIGTIGDSAGYFIDSARSYWTPDASGWDKDFQDADNAPDGKESRKGGVASVLTSSRNVYTYLGSNSSLTNSANQVHESNANITEAMLSVPDAATRTSLLQWARGIDVSDEDGDSDTSEPRKVMGDPLHGEPALITYGGSDTNPDMTAFIPTNDGYLHAISTRTGEEHFAFIPQELLGNLELHYSNNAASLKTYGLDGSVSAWVEYTDPSDPSLGLNKAYIYFGMRRGGNNYYALDVTDRANPRLVWTIQGGSGDFAELSETWSRPKLRKIKYDGQERFVLIFGGGYDTTQDSASIRVADTAGRAIYIVDAETGQRLWWASSQGSADLVLPDMDYSIPSDIAVVDTVGDGYANLMYVGDMGGQVWRFDIATGNAGTTLDGLITGGRIADLSVDNSIAQTRRFYYQPEVAIFEFEGTHYISVVIGSGYRAHPMNDQVEDRIYMLRDTPIRRAPNTYVTLTNSDLFDTTDNVIGDGTDSEQQTARSSLANADGWYIDLVVTGEKALSKPVVFNGSIYISTYIPNLAASTATSCSPREGGGRLYVMSVTDAQPTYNNDPTVDPDENDRFFGLDKAGIPPDPKFIKTNDPNQDDWAVCVGTECNTMPDTAVLNELYWFER